MKLISFILIIVFSIVGCKPQPSKKIEHNATISIAPIGCEPVADKLDAASQGANSATAPFVQGMQDAAGNLSKKKTYQSSKTYEGALLSLFTSRLMQDDTAQLHWSIP